MMCRKKVLYRAVSLIDYSQKTSLLNIKNFRQIFATHTEAKLSSTRNKEVHTESRL